VCKLVQDCASPVLIVRMYYKLLCNASQSLLVGAVSARGKSLLREPFFVSVCSFFRELASSCSKKARRAYII
jgi:hypothetical protein